MAEMDFGDEFTQALLNREVDSFKTKDDSGRYRNIFKTDVPNLNLYKPKNGDHNIDILAYRAGRHDPLTPEGAPTYFLDVWVHYGVGPTEDAYVCPLRTYGKNRNPLHKDPRCPRCEELADLKRKDPEEVDEKYMKSLEPKRRALYNIVCYDDASEEAKGVQIFDVAHFHMEKPLSERQEKRRTRAGSNAGPFIPFAHPTKGKTIFFTREGNPPLIEYKNHDFLDRDYTLPEAILKSVKQLDEIINIPTYEELYKAHYGYSPGEAPKAEPVNDFPEKAQPTRIRQPLSQAPAEKEAVLEGNKCPSGAVFGQSYPLESGACNTCEPDEIWQECARLSEEAKKAVEAAPAAAPAAAPGERRLRRPS